MAEFGAEVIKIESPDGGDPLRKWRKLYEGTSLWWYVQARNKKSVTVNLKHPAGREIVHKLVAEPTSWSRTSAPACSRSSAWAGKRCRRSTRAWSCCVSRVSARADPMAQQPGFGAIGESMGGLRYVTGFPDRPPVKTGISIGDSIAALWGVIGTLMALRHKERRVAGAGGRCRSLRGGLRDDGVAAPGVRRFRFRPRTDRQHHARHHAVEHAHHQDGKHVAIGANGDAIFKRLMLAIGRDDLADDANWPTTLGATRAATNCTPPSTLGGGARRSRACWTSLAAAEVPASRVYSAADMLPIRSTWPGR
jgi:formyl-CoA transferase